MTFETCLWGFSESIVHFLLPGPQSLVKVDFGKNKFFCFNVILAQLAQI